MGILTDDILETHRARFAALHECRTQKGRPGTAAEV
jgi:hypothetical protein